MLGQVTHILSMQVLCIHPTVKFPFLFLPQYETIDNRLTFCIQIKKEAYSSACPAVLILQLSKLGVPELLNKEED